jgi:hypothetical protein
MKFKNGDVVRFINSRSSAYSAVEYEVVGSFVHGKSGDEKVMLDPGEGYGSIITDADDLELVNALKPGDKVVLINMGWNMVVIDIIGYDLKLKDNQVLCISTNHIIEGFGIESEFYVCDLCELTKKSK